MNKFIKCCIKKFERKKKQLIVYTLSLLIGIAIIFLFLDLIKVLGFMLIFILGNMFLRFYRRILPGLPIELEIVILGTVTVSIAFGLWPGLIVAFFGSLLAEFFNQYISPYSLVNIITYMLIPFFTFFLPASNIAGIGITIAIIANIIIFSVFLFMGYDIVKNTLYSVTNIFFNYLFFTYLGDFLIGIMV